MALKSGLRSTISVVAAEPANAGRFIVHAEEIITAFSELQMPIDGYLELGSMGLGSARYLRRTGNSCSGNERYGQRLIAVKKVELAAKNIAGQIMNPHK